VTILSHKFVEFIPDTLAPAVLYLSIEHGTAVHRCCCGCGREVVTPITPNDWKIIFDGETISLRPSIGNWNFPCRSHYWITQNRVEWAEDWSNWRITAKEVKGRKLNEKSSDSFETIDSPEPGCECNKIRGGFWARFWKSW
jgi:hypothetical protein